MWCSVLVLFGVFTFPGLEERVATFVRSPEMCKFRTDPVGYVEWERGAVLLNQIQEGMTEDEVRSILGTPTVHITCGTGIGSTMVYLQDGIEIYLKAGKVDSKHQEPFFQADRGRSIKTAPKAIRTQAVP